MAKIMRNGPKVVRVQIESEPPGLEVIEGDWTGIVVDIFSFRGREDPQVCSANFLGEGDCLILNSQAAEALKASKKYTMAKKLETYCPFSHILLPNDCYKFI